ncbi:hypothetical protein NDU88_003238 [Pleurodeles waltl]|uniref:Uncharacterized protein n=1 Tax=Pleurodeles waltl TaxID=8319 RepID=A0AAV7W5E8_PLEWA|nr:hypothetical protein NDU88_003238 [Pleurodeles waltl]
MFERSAATPARSLDTCSILVWALHRRSEVVEAHEGKLEEQDAVLVNQEQAAGEIKDWRREDNASAKPGGHQHHEAPRHVAQVLSCIRGSTGGWGRNKQDRVTEDVTGAPKRFGVDSVKLSIFMNKCHFQFMCSPVAFTDDVAKVADVIS